MASPELAPAAVAAAHLRVTGCPAARDPECQQYRVYSADELRAALIELASRSPGPAPPPPPPLDPLSVIWQAATKRLAFPSTRMLLSQECRLLELRKSGRELLVVLEVAPEWRHMVQSRRDLVAGALAETMCCPVALQLREVAL